MKLKSTALFAVLYLMSSLACAEGLSGKWQTDLAAAAQAAQALPAPGEGGRALVLDLKVEADPNLNINSGTFGQITAKNGSRTLASQIRLEFLVNAMKVPCF